MGVFCKRRRKVITPFMLALWLFAFFVSVAHACGLEAGLEHAGINNTVAVSGHDGPDDGAFPNCDKFCADDLPLLAKLKAVQDPPTGQAFLQAAVIGELFQTPATFVPAMLASPDPPPGIAVHIRFVRLVL